jgi:hypothetical protein
MRVRLFGVCACYDDGYGERYGKGAGYYAEHGGVRVHVRVRVMVMVRVHVSVMAMVCVIMSVMAGGLW